MMLHRVRYSLFLFFFSLFAGTFCEKGSKSIQAFERLSDFQPHVTYGHFAVTLNFTDFEVHLLTLETWVSSNQVQTSSFVQSVLARLSSVVRDARLRIHGYADLFNAQHTRQKRDVSGFVGIGLSIFSLFSDYQMHSTLSEVKNRQNLFARQILSVTNATITSVKNLRILKGAIDVIKADVTSLIHVLKLETAVTRMLGKTTSFFNGLETLLSGRLSLGLVSLPSVKEEFQAFVKACEAVDFTPLFKDYNQIFQLPVSFAVENGVVQILVSVPITPKSMQDSFSLFRYRSLPVLVSGHLVRLRSDTDMIAFSKDYSQYMEVSSSMLDGCHRLGNVYFGHYPSVVKAAASPGCLKSIFLGTHGDLEQWCQVMFVRSNKHLERINSTAFVSYFSESEIGTLTCGNNLTHVTYKGYGIYNLHGGCHLSVADFFFVAAMDPIVLVEHVYSEIDGAFFNFSVSNFSSRLEKTLSEFQAIDLQDLKRGGEEVKDLDPWDLSNSVPLPWIICIVLGSLLILILLSVLLLYACRGPLLACMLRGKEVPAQDRRVDDMLEEFRSALADPDQICPPSCPPSPGQTMLQRSRNRLSVRWARNLNSPPVNQENLKTECGATPSAPYREDNVYTLAD
jgi:hypothetical protein